ncbi:hypothetical protein [Pseudooceanicola sp. MF1-13]|uniref:hypothetical protein n=1 Tax=Pseudooceanicola sp. MF1-13 TaxID=3379095 RepID=UPI00389265BD
MDHDRSQTNPDDPIVMIFTPALVAVLLVAEEDKGAPLTKDEVIAIRDTAACMTMKRSEAQQMVAHRGYSDVDPDYVWEDFQAVRAARNRPPNS